MDIKSRLGIVNVYRLKPDGRLEYRADLPVDEFCGLLWKALGDIGPIDPTLAYIGVTHRRSWNERASCYLKVVRTGSAVLS